MMFTRMSLGAQKLRLYIDAKNGVGEFYLRDIFTTINGSWEQTPANEYSVPDWARSEHLRPMSAPDYFDDAGADHHLFGKVLDVYGQSISTMIRYWSETNGDGTPKEPIERSTGEKKSGWANIPIWSSFNPDRNEHGAWNYAPIGNSEVLMGASLPSNLHVSTFAVWQRRTSEVSPPPIVPPIISPGGADPFVQHVMVTQANTIIRIRSSIPFAIEVVNGEVINAS